jgi:uncharacterized protein
MTMYRFAAGTLRAGALAFTLVSLPLVTHAQQLPPPSAAHLQIARDVVEVSGATRAFDTVIPGMMQQAYSMFVQQNPDLQKPLQESIAAIRPEFDGRRGEIRDIVATVYAKKFSEPELKELLTFYRSATGKKFVAEISGVLEESFSRTQEWGGKLSEDVVARLRVEMKKRGHAI